MGDFPFIDIILFAMIAAFLVLRLRSVLGRRDGNDGSGHRDPSFRCLIINISILSQPTTLTVLMMLLLKTQTILCHRAYVKFNKPIPHFKWMSFFQVQKLPSR
jgi:hypothetical protein